MGLHISLLRHRRSVQVTLSLSHCIIQFWLFYAAKYYKTHRFENYNTEEFDPNRSGARGFFKRTGLSDIMQQGGHGLDSVRKGALIPSEEALEDPTPPVVLEDSMTLEHMLDDLMLLGEVVREPTPMKVVL